MFTYDPKTGYNFNCTNCSKEVRGATSCVTSKDGKHKFCDTCGGILDALYIGDPHTSSMFLYDDGKGHATSWTGAILGTITHKQAPGEYRQFGHGRGPFLTTRNGMRGAVRYRVRMLDDSMWWGHGPTDNGTYIRLRRMK